MFDDNRIFLGLGSNIDDRFKYLQNGILMLEKNPHIWVVKKSFIYKSKPMYKIDQNNFFNMVIEINTNLEPLDLLFEVKNIENKNGRDINDKKNSPRTLDIDILSIGDMKINNSTLSIPHPMLFERKFVLKPWSDIAPDFIVIDYKLSVLELLNETPDKSELNIVLVNEGLL
jgi:2-amino-4-hydroxy-6-hydroxymethyldihydropteridine diphosphokinase